LAWVIALEEVYVVGGGVDVVTIVVGIIGTVIVDDADVITVDEGVTVGEVELLLLLLLELLELLLDVLDEEDEDELDDELDVEELVLLHDANSVAVGTV
jgi:hypothetical protein